MLDKLVLAFLVVISIGASWFILIFLHEIYALAIKKGLQRLTGNCSTFDILPQTVRTVQW
jgi:hypothetical protein